MNQQGENRHLWKKGQSGNPAGRPVGSRQKLADSFLKDLEADWSKNGEATLPLARMADPMRYAQMVASILPKDVQVSVSQSDASGADMLAWPIMREALTAISGAIGDGAKPEDVIAVMVDAVRGHFAKVIDGR